MDHWFLSMSIRNRQTTVYPFIFQHAKEYADMSQFKARSSHEQEIEICKEPEYTESELENYEDINF